jgi:hypothetical protein
MALVFDGVSDWIKKKLIKLMRQVDIEPKLPRHTISGGRTLEAFP